MAPKVETTTWNDIIDVIVRLAPFEPAEFVVIGIRQKARRPAPPLDARLAARIME